MINMDTMKIKATKVEITRRKEDDLPGYKNDHKHYKKSDGLSSFEFNEQATEGMISGLKNYATGLVEGKAREEAAKVLYHVKERFISIFNYDNDSTTRVWTDKEDIKEMTKNARSSCVTLLSVLAAIRLDNGSDTIRETLSLAWDPETSQIAQNTLASSTWEKSQYTKKQKNEL
ncbi:protein root hair defective 3 [Tanacetum coccineum]